MKFKKGDKVRVMGTKTVYIVVEKYADSIDLVRLIDDDSGMYLGFREGVLELAFGEEMKPCRKKINDFLGGMLCGDITPKGKGPIICRDCYEKFDNEVWSDLKTKGLLYEIFKDEAPTS